MSSHNFIFPSISSLSVAAEPTASKALQACYVFLHGSAYIICKNIFTEAQGNLTVVTQDMVLRNRSTVIPDVQ